MLTKHVRTCHSYVDYQDFSRENTSDEKKSPKKIKITLKEYPKNTKTNHNITHIPKKKLNSTEKDEQNSELPSEISKQDFQCKICLSDFQNFEELAEHVEEKHIN